MTDLYFKEPEKGDLIVSKRSSHEGILKILSVRKDINKTSIVVASKGKYCYRFILDHDEPCARQNEFWYAQEYLGVLEFESNMQEYALSKKKREIKAFKRELKNESV